MKPYRLSTILFLSVLSVLLLAGVFLSSAASASQHPIVRSHGVVFSTGNKHQAETDLRLENSVQTLSLKRYYNSQSTRLGVFGYGWSGGIPEFSALSVDGDLIVQTFAKGRKKLYADDGSGNWVSKAGDKETITATASGYEYIELTGSVNQYDADGKLLDITDKNGNQLIFTYAGDKLSTISDSVGRTFTFGYTGDLITTITTPIGYYIYGYDTDNNLTSVAKPDGTTRTYLYDDPNDVHNLTGIFDEENERIQTVGYDDSDRVVSSSLKGGAEALTFAYTGGLERQITDSRGVTTTYQITVNGGVGRVASITGPGCTTCGGSGAGSSYSYNDRALLVQATDGNGHKTSYDYDDSGNRTRLVEADSSLLRRITTYTYETGSNRLATITRDSSANSGQSVITTYTYDVNHNPETIVTNGYDGTTAISRTITYDYDSLGRITLVDGPRTDVTDTVSFAYYPNSSDQGNNRANLNSVTNGLGHVVTYQDYNLLGQPQTIILPTTTVTLTYDDLGRMTSRTVGGLTTSFGYDLAGSLESITLPGNRVITYDYDTAGYLERVTDNKGNYITFSYDTNGNRTDEDIYDPSGLLHGYADFGYDDYGGLETTTLADGSQQTRGYDEVGNLVSLINGMSQTSTYDYDTLDRLTTITEPGSVISQFGYDKHDNLLLVTDAEERATTYLHDDFGRRVARTSPDTGTTGFTYDESGNITSVTDANTNTIEYRYDALNRPTGTDLPGTANYYSFSYDQGTNSIGHLSQITDPHGSQSYSYDNLGRVTGESRVTGSVTSSTFYNYDPVTGDLTTLTYPSGLALSYQRDENGAVTGITAGGQPLLQNGEYLPFGPVDSYRFGNGQQMVRSFDQRYQLTDIQVQGSIITTPMTSTDGSRPLKGWFRPTPKSKAPPSATKPTAAGWTLRPAH